MAFPLGQAKVPAITLECEDAPVLLGRQDGGPAALTYAKALVGRYLETPGIFPAAIAVGAGMIFRLPRYFTGTAITAPE
jgi:hypothetical protein